jgi:hypothetical protein
MYRRNTEGPALWLAPVVLFQQNTVMKEVGAHFAEDEFAKALAIADIAADHGFVAPLPMEFDGSAGTVTYERLRNLDPLKTMVLRPPGTSSSQAANAHRLIAAAGAAIGSIHLHLSGGVRSDHDARVLPRPLRPIIGTYEPMAYAHGDFSLANLFVRDNTLVILDSSPNGYSSTQVFSYESIYFDLGLFVGALCGRGSFHSYDPRRTSELSRLTDTFITSYEQVSGVTVCPTRLFLFAEHQGATYYSMARQLRSPVRSAALFAHRALLRRVFKQLNRCHQ